MSSTQPSDLRKEISRISRPVLVRLHAVPRPAFLLVWLGLIAVSVWAPIGVAIPAVVLVVLATGWLTYLSWPVIPASGKALRVLVLVLLIAAAVVRFS